MLDGMEDPKARALDFACKEFIFFLPHTTVVEALAAIRKRGMTDGIAYFYVCSDDGTLTGTLPVRRLISSNENVRVEEIMIREIVSIQADTTMERACEIMLLHKLLALPILDDSGKIVAVIDLTAFTGGEIDAARRHEVEQAFQVVGFRTSNIANRSPFVAFWFRFPWLIATIVGGIASALIVGAFEATISQSIMLTFFLTIILGLGESVACRL